MLKWYQVTAPSKDALHNVLKSLRKQHLMARRHDGNIIACISDNHEGWLANVCRDFNAGFSILEQAPKGVRVPTQEVYPAPCGVEFYDPIQYAHHFRTCKKCKKEGITAKLEPGVELNLNGVISSIEVTRDQLWEKVEAIDALLTNLKAYRDAKGKLTELMDEASKRVDAVRLLLRDGKL